MSSLYIESYLCQQQFSTNALVDKLRRVCGLLDAVIQSDRSRYLEARTWLLNSIAEQSPPAAVRLACWEPLLADALAGPSLPSPPPRQPPASGLSRGSRDFSDGKVSDRSGGGDGLGEAGRRAGPTSLELLMQLLLLVSEVWPDRVAELLLDRPDVFVEFFQGPGSARRVLLWFSHFSMEGLRSFKFGAHALAHYALAHREQMWDLLQWEGKHPQAPVAVAAKTHYFCELALQPSVRALLRHHPQFWASEQWRQCCSDGAFLDLDRRHFCKVLLSDLRSGGSGAHRLTSLIRDFLADTSSPARWQLLCQRLLHQLNDPQLLALINSLAAATQLLTPHPTKASRGGDAAAGKDPATFVSGPSGVGPQPEDGSHGPQTLLPRPHVVTGYFDVCGPGGWQDLLGLVLGGGVRWGSLAEAVLAHALAASRGPLQRLLAEEREELGGRLEVLEQEASVLHGAQWRVGSRTVAAAGEAAREEGEMTGTREGALDEEDFSPAVHAALLYGGRLSLQDPHSGADRLLLLAEMWTLREALRRSEAAGSAGPPSAGVRLGAGDDPAADAGHSGSGGSGRAAAAATEGLLQPLERVMAGVEGISFERLQGGPGGAGGSRGITAGRSASPAPGVHGDGDAAGAAAAAGKLGCGTDGHYELLSSEDELGAVVGGGRAGRRRAGRRRRRRDKSRKMKRRRAETESTDDGDGGGQAREMDRVSGKGAKRSRRRGRSSSRSRGRSSSRSRSRGRRRRGAVGIESDPSSGDAGSDGAGSSSSDDGDGRKKDKRRKRRRRRQRRSRSSGRSSSSKSSSRSRSRSRRRKGASSGAGGGSDEDAGGRAGEKLRKGLRRQRERCGSSGPDGDKSARTAEGERRRHSRSPSCSLSRSRSRSRHRRDRKHGKRKQRQPSLSADVQLQGSRRSSTLDFKAAARSGFGFPYGHRRSDSGELLDVDPLVAIQGRGALLPSSFAGPAGGSAAGAVWRVRLPSGGGRTADGSPGAVGAAGLQPLEVVGGCDDVADLLAAVACKHWAAAMLFRDSGGSGGRDTWDRPPYCSLKPGASRGRGRDTGSGGASVSNRR